MALKVFDLQCDQGHVFEGWFSSHDDYHHQQEHGLLTCPMCNSRTVVRQVSAARINRGAAPPGPEPAGAAGQPHTAGNSPEGGRAGAGSSVMPPELQAELMRAMRAMVRNAEDVGPRFATEARAIHQGEAPERAIRGVATPAERAALVEEGIAAIPLPDVFNDNLH